MLLSSLQETVSSLPHKTIFLSSKPFQVKGAEKSVLKTSPVAAAKEKGRRRSLVRKGDREAKRLEYARFFQRKDLGHSVEMKCKKQVGMATSYLNERHRFFFHLIKIYIITITV